MLKKLFKKTYLVFNKVKVIHSIPGRIRLFIPSLNMIPEQFKKYENYTTSLLKLKKGIKTITYSYSTSKILIEYDSKNLNEKEVVEWLNKIWRIIVDNEELYNGMSANEIENNMKKFYELLKNELERR